MCLRQEPQAEVRITRRLRRLLKPGAASTQQKEVPALAGTHSTSPHRVHAHISTDSGSLFSKDAHRDKSCYGLMVYYGTGSLCGV